MNEHGEAQFTGKYGYFQNRGGFRAYAGFRGAKYRRKSTTAHEMSDANHTEVKTENVPDATHHTTHMAPVDKDMNTVQPEKDVPVVADG